jgi:tRNA dimethylallyltransferase
MPKKPDHKAQTKPVLVIAGPTASGKSRLAMDAAEALGGVIINADSMQVYRELAVLTARPGAAEMARVPHRLYGTLPGSERCSAGRWQALAVAEIEACHAAGQLPIVVGGTGLYLRALEKGLADLPEVPAATRAAAEALHGDLGGKGFHAALAVRDPAMAARLRPTDRQRLVRAWEVLEATGRSLADWQSAGAAAPPAPYGFCHVICLPPRPALYAACDVRVLAMMEAGALEEVRALCALGLDPALPVMKALGVAALRRHLAGELSREAAIAAMQQQTRNYAKRQMTWLRTQLLPERPEAMIVSEQYSESLWAEIFKNIRQIILTR